MSSVPGAFTRRDSTRRGILGPSTAKCRRFAEYHDLQGAFGRRALIERATGILMERHSIDEESAFEMLRAVTQ
jgi:ANTAR domain